MSSYTLYIAECADGSLYTGITTDVTRRIAEHNGAGSRGARATRARRPVILRYTEVFPSRSDALKREYAIKQLSRTEKWALFAHH